MRHRTSVAEVAVATAVLVVSGCGRSHATHWVMAVDSDGVEVVTNTAEGVGSAPKWFLSDSAALEIRTSDTVGSPPLLDVVGLAELRRGRIALGNRGSQRVLVYDSVGKLIRAIGGRGEGPNELGRLASVVSLGADSLGVYDLGRGRVVVYGPDGHVARSFSTTELTTAGGSSWLMALSNRDFLLVTEAGTDGVGVHRSKLEAYRLSAEGAVLGTLGPFKGEEGYVTQSGLRGATVFGPRTRVVAVGNRLVVGTADAPEIDLYSDTGRLLRIVRWPDRSRDVTAEDVSHYIEAAAATVPEAERPMVRKLLRATPVSARFPAYDRLLESRRGNCWVGIYSPPTLTSGVARYGSRRWLVVGSDGAIRARVTTPEGFDVRVIDGARVIGVYLNALGEESVRVYALHRGQQEEGGDQ